MNEPLESPELPEPSEPVEPPATQEIVEASPDELPDAPPPVTYASPGGCLRDARVARGLAIADVAHSIKFSPRQIETLERDDFDMLPGTTFVRGFIRSYAKLLRLDDHMLLAMLDQQKPQTDVQIHLPADTGAALPQSGEQRSYFPYLILLVVLAAIGVGLATYFDLPGQTEKTKSASNSAAPILQPPLAYIEQPSATRVEPGQPAPQDAAPLGPDIRQLIFVFDEKSWVEVKDATQRVIFAQNNEPGTRQVVNGKPPFALVIGNASHVQLQYEDQQVDLSPHTKVDVARLTLE